MADAVDPEERLEFLTAALEDLAEANRTAPVVVEGDRDVRALRSLGLRGEVVSLNRGAPVFATCEALAARHRDAIVLTDWDHRGGRLARLLREGLAANGVRVNMDLRARLTILCRKDIKDVESLPGFLERVGRDASGRVRGKASKRWYARRGG